MIHSPSRTSIERFPPLHSVREPLDEEPGDAAGGCGWFDSSFELAHGLEVSELEWSDANPPAFMAG